MCFASKLYTPARGLVLNKNLKPEVMAQDDTVSFE